MKSTLQFINLEYLIVIILKYHKFVLVWCEIKRQYSKIIIFIKKGKINFNKRQATDIITEPAGNCHWLNIWSHVSTRSMCDQWWRRLVAQSDTVDQWWHSGRITTIFKEFEVVMFFECSLGYESELYSSQPPRSAATSRRPRWPQGCVLHARNSLTRAIIVRAPSDSRRALRCGVTADRRLTNDCSRPAVLLTDHVNTFRELTFFRRHSNF